MDEKVKLTVEVPRSLWKRAKLRAVEEERDLRDVVIESLERYLDGVPKKGRTGNAR
jgi:hypothetical protein